MIISAEELQAYSVFDRVKNRSVERLAADIIEAEAAVFQIVGHDFTHEKYQPIPEKARIALLKMAQYFAMLNDDESMMKGLTSEKMGDYSYAKAADKVKGRPYVYALLVDYIEPSLTGGSANLKVRSL
ncbi:DUF3199 family protein [Bacillus altitudinis]|jgi:hypothetical protein|uniref:protein YqbG n=1 Tax=Bacillus TaxID=1386 RepID=UPI000405A9A1|nr:MULTISPECIES: DUF3199 family protein [Bacillus]AMM90169.1 hypothetical protein UP15_14785 [Bacillus pumilus]KQL43145.1 hypothetical protein AN962_06300 [Bacillus sp. FJAT-21955]MDN0040653.1 DUF3199 family protein [Bacillus aerophilus]ALM28155.1 hypothetical protein AKO65_09035 [Bacillus altitudinis]ALM44695.1 hypothetical protein AMR71_05345 [Bacillus altitudinis]